LDTRWLVQYPSSSVSILSKAAVTTIIDKALLAPTENGHMFLLENRENLGCCARKKTNTCFLQRTHLNKG
jgi:hypothetical protein